MAPSPDRTVVVGTSGAGKSTLARRVTALRGAPCVELDALRWEPGWVEAPDPVMRERVTTAIAGDRWVVDGNSPPFVHLRTSAEVGRFLAAEAS